MSLSAAPCPLCRQAAEFLLEAACPDSPEGPLYSFFRCESCGVGFVHPLPSSGFGEQAYFSSYYGRWGLVLGLVNRLLLANRRRRIERLAPKGRLLDFGCGSGDFLMEMRRNGWETRGVEPSASGRALLPAPLKGEVRESLAAFRGPAERFDVITLWHVLEHLPDPKGILLELRPLLKEEGLLFIAVPNLSSWEFERAGSDWFHLDIPRHLVHFTPEGLRRLLAETGYATERVSHFSWAYNVFGLYQTWLNQLTGRRNVFYDRFKRGRGVGLRELTVSILASPFALLAAGPACLVLGLQGRAGTMEAGFRPK